MLLPLPSDDEIVAARERHPQCDPSGRYAITGFPYPPEAPTMYIKCSSEQHEIRNHQFALLALEKVPVQNRIGVRIPEIYHSFKRGGLVFIVMQLVRGRTLLDVMLDGTADDNTLDDMFTLVGRGLNLFLNFDIPPGVAPGPCGGGRIRHQMFKDCEAAIEYVSVAQLQKHVNNVATTRGIDPPTVDFSNEPVRFCYTDLYAANFLFDEDGCLYIIDFDQAAFLPISFMAYAVDQPRRGWAGILDALEPLYPLPKENLPGMKRAASWFGMSTEKIGLPV